MNYPIADFIIRIKNAYLANRKVVVMPYSNMNKSIAKALIKEGFLAEVKIEEVDGKKNLKALLRYENRKPILHDCVIVSKPSLRVYINTKDLQSAMRREAMVSILSTSQGILSGREAQKKGLGGELLFKVW